MADELRTRDGVSLEVRPIEPGDREALADGFHHLNAESRYKRFLTPVKELTRPSLDYLTRLDHGDHEALIALTDEGEIVGVARYIRLADRPEVAEVAVTVADDWQGRGVGSGLLARLVERAEDNGIEDIVGICLAYNASMIHLLEEAGRVVDRHAIGGGAVEIEVELPVSDARERGSRTLRAAARAQAGDGAAGPR
jgi:RimJ/RimL family protein N-acetyltransferase